MTAAEGESGRDRVVVPKEVVPDHLAVVAEAENELGVTPRAVVPHDVPEDRTGSDPHHRFRHALGLLPHAHSESTTENHDFHVLLASPGPQGRSHRRKATGKRQLSKRAGRTRLE
jgi:hypothetical protein